MVPPRDGAARGVLAARRSSLGCSRGPVAFVLSGQMAVAYFHSHFPLSFFPTVNNVVAAVLYKDDKRSSLAAKGFT